MLRSSFFMKKNIPNWVVKMMYQKYSKLGCENDVPKIFKIGLRK